MRIYISIVEEVEREGMKPCCDWLIVELVTINENNRVYISFSRSLENEGRSENDFLN